MEIVTEREEYLNRVAAQCLPFIYYFEGIHYRVETTPVAFTAACMDGAPEKGWFLMGIPKIPISILKGIYLFFNYISDEYETEVRVQVFFDPNRKMYEVYLPNQEVTSASIYTLDAEYAYMQKTGYWPVLDIHSHCRYPAIFSATDNNYEKGSWIYGVIGSLGRFPQLLLRAGSGGYYVPICERDVFDLSAASDDSMCTQVYEKLVGQQDRLQKMDGD